jgi:hypothetical protein
MVWTTGSRGQARPSRVVPKDAGSIRASALANQAGSGVALPLGESQGRATAGLTARATFIGIGRGLVPSSAIVTGGPTKKRTQRFSPTCASRSAKRAATTFSSWGGTAVPSRTTSLTISFPSLGAQVEPHSSRGSWVLYLGTAVGVAVLHLIATIAALSRSMPPNPPSDAWGVLLSVLGFPLLHLGKARIGGTDILDLLIVANSLLWGAVVIGVVMLTRRRARRSETA